MSDEGAMSDSEPRTATHLPSESTEQMSEPFGNAAEQLDKAGQQRSAGSSGLWKVTKLTSCLTGKQAEGVMTSPTKG